MEETQKIDKRIKSYKTTVTHTDIPETNDTRIEAVPSNYAALKIMGIPLKMIVTRYAIKFIGKNEAPQTSFYDPTDYKGSSTPTLDKRAKMWYTPHGVICERNDQIKIVPLANIIDNILL